MINVRFLSFYARQAGVKTIELKKGEITVREALIYIIQKIPDLEKYIDLDDPEFTLIKDGKTLQLPGDYSEKISNELVLSPIIAGG